MQIPHARFTHPNIILSATRFIIRNQYLRQYMTVLFFPWYPLDPHCQLVIYIQKETRDPTWHIRRVAAVSITRSPQNVLHSESLIYRGYFVQETLALHALWIQTLSEKVLKPPNHSKLYPKHFLRRYLDP